MPHPDLLTPYPVQLAGVTRHLTRVEIAPGVVIAILNILGDTELTEAVAAELVKRLPAETEFLVTPEAKSIPLCYAMSVKSGLPYAVLRKSFKPYMLGSIGEEVVSITTGAPQKLWLDGKDIERVRGKRVVIVDDVISTGGTLRGARSLLEQAGAEVIASVAILTEGDESAWRDVITLGNLPVWFDRPAS
ncbi:MAG: adenine phosphoribosyltransferase [Caldilineales bacterium]|nr:adenine phosphoribosyltransferase [Caldilineales bacterium]MCW5857986.1 adenine phosphoribosyltransferase [Caldilineales bacterium]